MTSRKSDKDPAHWQSDKSNAHLAEMTEAQGSESESCEPCPAIQSPMSPIKLPINLEYYEGLLDEHLFPDFLDDILTKELLLSLLRWLPNAEPCRGREGIIRDILKACEDPKYARRKLFETKEFYNNHLLKLVRVTWDSQPGLLEPVEAPNPPDDSPFLGHTKKQPNRENSFLTGLEDRQSYRCEVTGFSTWCRISNHPILPSNTRRTTVLKKTHIVPHSLVNCTAGKENDPKDRLNLLYRCFPLLEKILPRMDINELCNGIMMVDALDSPFGFFEVAFEAIENEPHSYYLVQMPNIMREDLGDNRSIFKSGTTRTKVTFRDARSPPDENDLPSPMLLDFHWRMANIFNDSPRNTHAIDHGVKHWVHRPDPGEIAEDGSTSLVGIVNIAIEQLQGERGGCPFYCYCQLKP